MDDGNALGFSNPISENNFTCGRTSGIDHSFEFHAAKDVFIATVSVLRNAAGIEKIVASF